jgi:ATP-dependent DNA ligase
LPLVQRQRALEKLIPATTTVLSRVFTIEERGRDVFVAAQRMELEGIVAKWKAVPYDADSTCWYKIENPSYTQGEGRRELFQ